MAAIQNNNLAAGPMETDNLPAAVLKHRSAKPAGENRLGCGKSVRNRKMQQKPALMGVTQPAIRRLARRAGVKRISGLIYEETRNVLRHFIEDMMRITVPIVEHAKRHTATATDIVYALKRKGITLYGFGGDALSWGPKKPQKRPVSK